MGLATSIYQTLKIIMDLQIRNKRALVTASTSGIGLAIAQALAAEGARVIVNGRTQERVNAALAQVRGRPPV
jgi:NAD(P)-dependent dehydrogenase (short-subunit alcohol dehydrogenase family)